jgi:ribosome-associated protein
VKDSKPSKSERKRTEAERQNLGEALIDMQDQLLASLSLDERLFDAIHDARRMKSHEAQRRQRQFIGKLMRNVDPEPIVALLTRLKSDDRREKRVFADAERWRDRLVNQGPQALQAFNAEIGQSSAELGALLAELERAGSDREEITIRRKLFRCVHETLAAYSIDG